MPSANPILIAGLAHKTGVGLADGLTSDDSIGGRVTATQPVTAFTGSLDFASGSVDLAGLLQVGGYFLLDPAVLAGIAGGAMTVGFHTLHLTATDGALLSTQVDVTFSYDPVAPVLLAGLANPTGTVAGLTNDPTISGSVADAQPIAALRASLDGHAATSIAASLAGGGFTLDPAMLAVIAGGTLAGGAHVLHLLAIDYAGNAATTDIAFDLETAPPVLSAFLLRDTGASAMDGVTFDPSIGGQLGAATGIASLTATLDGSVPADLLAALLPGGGVQIGATLLATLAGGSLAEGAHTLHLVATDNAGNMAQTDVAFTLDTTAPGAPAFDLASGFGVPGSHQTGLAVVDLVGTADPGTTISLLAAGISAVADGGGTFTLAGVHLTPGQNQVSLTATDAAGNATSGSVVLTRVTVPGQANAVLTWDQIALDAVQATATDPEFTSRALAIESIAVLDASNAIGGIPGFLVSLAAPAGISASAAIAAAAHEALVKLLPGAKVALDAQFSASLALETPGTLTDAAVAFGTAMADAVLAIRAADGSGNRNLFDDGSTDPGKWRPTAPGFTPGLDPQFATLVPFALTSAAQFASAGPPALDGAAYAASLAQVEALGAAGSTTRTADQTQAALFWNDQAGSFTPPGSWNVIATSVAAASGASMATDALVLAQLNVALADAGIAAWNAKYTFDLWRPITAIHLGVDGIAADPGWTPLITTPNFPSYVSGHSTFSNAAATVLGALLPDGGFSTDSSSLPGVVRSYANFAAAAAEAGESRVWGGIHYDFDNADGAALGALVGAQALASFQSAVPRLSLVVKTGTAVTTTGGLTLAGLAFDNVAPLTLVAASLDGGAVHDIAVGPGGAFSAEATALFGAVAPGVHEIALFASDGASGIARTIAWTVAGAAPVVNLSSPGGGAITAGAHLSGIASGGGAAITSLGYTIDGGIRMPVGFDAANGAFDAALDLSRLGAGAHTLAVTATSAGGTTTVTRTETLDATIPLTVTAITPRDGAGTIGATVRPAVTFSRAVDPATLTASSFFATGPDGSVLPATIVPTADGTGASLFFAGPMPGSSTITLHLIGSLIAAQADGMALDADGTGTPGSDLASTLTTVSTAAVIGTVLTGVLADPGPDGIPGTADDVATGADGSLTYLLPIAGVTVSILGMPGLSAVTDAQGRFTLTGMPAGDAKVVLDGTGAANAPAGMYFPEMTMDVTLRPGEVNTIMGGMGTAAEQAARSLFQGVYLPRIPLGALTPLSDVAPTTVIALPTPGVKLTAGQLALVSLTIQPGSAIGAEGLPMSGTMIGISAVPSQLVQEMLPAGILQHSFDITIQSRGADVQSPGAVAFSIPAVLTMPNVFDLAPGQQTYFLSFDHTTGRLVIDGTATASADGLTVTTDPGTGITRPGWHGIAPPGTPGSPPTGPGGNSSSTGTPDPDCATLISSLDLIKGLGPKSLDALGGASTITAKLGGASGALFATAGLVLDIRSAVATNHDPSATRQEKIYHWTEVALDIASIAGPLKPLAVAARAAFTAIDIANDYYDLQTDILNRKIAIQNCLRMRHTAIAQGNRAEALQPDAEPDPLAVPAGRIEAALAAAQAEFVIQIPLWLTYLDQLQLVQDALAAANTASPDTALGLTDAQQDALNAELDTLASDYAAVAARPSLEALMTEVKLAYGGFLGAASDLVTPAAAAGDPPSLLGGVIYAVLQGDDGTVERFQFDPHGGYTQYLQPNMFYSLSGFDPVSQSIGFTYFRSAASGSPTVIPRLPLAPDAGIPGADGLSLDAAFVIGVDNSIASNFVPGMTDLAALREGLTDGRANANGIVAVLPLQGEALRVVIAGALANPAQLLAFVATGSHGLAIADVTSRLAPVLLGELALPGQSTDVAVDTTLGLAVVAAGGGLHIVDIAIPGAPALLRTVPVAAGLVRLHDGIAYVSDGADIVAVDVPTGLVLQRLAPGGGAIVGLTLDGDTLYAIDTGHVLRAIDITLPVMRVASFLQLPVGGASLFAADGLIYVPRNASNSSVGGYLVVHGGAALHLVGQSPGSDAAAWLALNGSGLGVGVQFVGAFTGGATGSVLDVFNTADPATTGRFISRYALPANPADIAIGGGIAYVADTSAGLQVVNYTTIATGGVAPTITVRQTPGGNLPGATAIQLVEGGEATYRASFADPGQLRGVELLLNGATVVNDVSYPYDLTTLLPSIAANGSNHVTLQLRATDTGGNVSLTAPIAVTLLPDTTPPLLTGTNLAADDVHGQGFRHVTYSFSEPLDPATLTAANFRLVGPGNLPIAPLSIRSVFNGREVWVSYAPLGVGLYRTELTAAGITDRAGNPLGTLPVTTAFSVVANLAEWDNPAGGNWTDAGNWLAEQVPAAGDTVDIALGGSTQVTFAGGATVAALGLSTGGVLNVAAGNLAVAGDLRVDAGRLALTGGLLDLAGTLDLAGGTFELASGTLQHATLAIAGGEMVYGGGILDGVTFIGTLGLRSPTGAASLAVRNGLTVTSGTIDGTGAGAIQLAYLDSETLDAVTLRLGATNGAALVVAGAGLALGAGTHMLQPYGALTISGTTLDTAGRLDVVAGSFTSTLAVLRNTGTLAFGSAAGGTIDGSLDNAGLITVAGGSVLHAGQGGLANAGTLVVAAGGTLDLRGAVALADLGTLANAGLLQISGKLDLGGGTMDVAPGGRFAHVLVSASVANGTLHDGGGRLELAQFASLEAITYLGTLALHGPLTIGGGLTVRDSVLAPGGTIDMTALPLAADSLATPQMFFSDDITLDNLVVLTGVSPSSTSPLILANGTHALTLASHVTVQQTGGRLAIGAGGSLVTAGTILLDGGSFQIGAGTATNTGTISLVNGESAEISAASFTNAGSIAIGGGSLLVFDQNTGFGNFGTISIAPDATLDVQGSLALASLGALANAGALVLHGTVDLAGGTADLRPGSALGNVTIENGVLRNGTVLAGGGMPRLDDATLVGVTILGTLAVSGGLVIANGLIVRDSALAPGGTIDLRAATGGLSFTGSQSLDHVTILAGPGASFIGAQVGGTLTLGASTTLIQTGGVLTGLGLDNAGHITIEFGGFTPGSAGFANTGTMDVHAGGTLAMGSGTLTNAGLIAVGSFGMFSVEEGARLANATGTITVADHGRLALTAQADAGHIDIAAGGTLVLRGTTLFGGLAQVSDAGQLVVEAGATLDLGGGTLDLAAAGPFRTLILRGVVTNGTMTLGAGGTLAVQDDGHLDASVVRIGAVVPATTTITAGLDLAGGTLDIVTGTQVSLLGSAISNGTIRLDGGAFEVRAIGQAELDAIDFIGTLALRNDQLRLRHSLTVHDSPGAASGTIDLTEGGNQIFLMSGLTLDHLTLLTGQYGNAIFNNVGTDTTVFGAGMTLRQADGFTELASGTFDNLGQMVLAGGTLYAGTAALINHGTIALDKGEALVVASGRLANAGAIAIAGGAALHTGPGAFANTGSIVVAADATLDIGGAVTPGALGSIAGAGLLQFSGALDLGGGTLDARPGAAFANTLASGTLAHGTVLAAGGTIALDNATLDDITWIGTLRALTPLSVQGGLRVRDAVGASTGTIDLAVVGAQNFLQFQDSETLDHVTLKLGGRASTSTVYAAAGTLTLGNSALLTQSVGTALVTVDGLVNQGLIQVTGGNLGVSAARFANAGTMQLATGGTASLATASFANTGSIAIDGNAVLQVTAASGFSNTGSIAIGSHGTLDLNGQASLAGLGSIGNGGVLRLSGIFDLGGGTLDVRSQRVALSGMVRNGTIITDGADDGTGIDLQAGAVLDHITWAGPFGGLEARVEVVNGLTVQTQGGILPGTLDLRGGTGSLLFDTQTLDNVAVLLGGLGAIPFGQGSGGTTLTLGPAATMSQAGGAVAVDVFSAGTGLLVNLGLISLASGVFTDFYQGFDNSGRLLLDRGEIFTVVGGADHGFLNHGTLAIGIDSVFQTGAGSFANTGTIALAGRGTLDMQGTHGIAALGLVTGPGQILVSGTLDLGGGTLDVQAGTGFSDVVVTGAITGGVVTIHGGRFTLLGGGTATVIADAAGTHAAAAQASLLDPPCFAAGTRILTARGEVAVEQLVVGDLVATSQGARLAPIVWLGHRHVACARHPRSWDVQPIRISAGAFAAGVPHRDLLLSPDHAVFVGGVLIPVRYLVNGATIVREQIAAVTYWHVELDRHAVILADGLPCESYLDTGNRGAFLGGGPALHLHPDFALRIWENAACAPLVVSGAKLAAARHEVLRRAKALGFEPAGDPGLRIDIGGSSLRPRVLPGGIHRVAVPADSRTVLVVSNSGVPAEIGVSGCDTRRLGVMITHMILRRQGWRQEIPLDSAAIGNGFHRLEREAGRLWRWTDGCGRLALPDGLSGCGSLWLDLHIGAAQESWAAVARVAAAESDRFSTRRGLG